MSMAVQFSREELPEVSGARDPALKGEEEV